jgi:hypothetical protein
VQYTTHLPFALEALRRVEKEIVLKRDAVMFVPPTWMKDDFNREEGVG